MPIESFHNSGLIGIRNEYVEVAISPEHGGSVVRAVDLRTGKSLMDEDWTWRACHDGRVAARIQEGADRAAIILYQNCRGTGVDFHGSASLAEGRAAILFEGRHFNRTWGQRRSIGGVSPFDPIELDFVPRQVHEWRRELPVFVEEAPFAESCAAASLSVEGRLRLQVIESLENATILVELADGTRLQTNSNLDPARPHEFAVEGDSNEIASVIVLDCTDQLVEELEFNADQTSTIQPNGQSVAPQFDQLVERWYEPLAEVLERDQALRSAVRGLRAREAMRTGQFEQAAVQLQDALAANAEDPLLWTTLATARRLGGNLDEGEREELVAAMELAPFEPTIRAETFLSMPKGGPKEPNPILQELAADREATLEVACHLLEHGLHADAARFIDEALRHHENPPLRYLYAWSLLTNTRMEVEAAAQVHRVEGEPIEGPAPSRPTEVRAVRELASRFPHSNRLAELAGQEDGPPGGIGEPGTGNSGGG